MKGTKYLISFLVVVALVLGIQTSSHAIATLSLSDGITTVIVADGGVGDLNVAADAVTFSGTVGAWLINVSTGLTNSALGGTPAAAHMDLNSVNVLSSGASTLTIRFSEIDYTGLLSGGIFSSILQAGGTLTAPAGSSVGFSAFLDPGNGLFVQTSPIGTIGPFGPGAFSGTGGGSAATGTPFSLTLDGILTFAGPGSASFNYELQSVPEPISLILLGSGLAGVGLYRRLRKPRG